MQTAPIGEPDSDDAKTMTAAAAGAGLPSTGAPVRPATLTLEYPELYINRELSLLEFQNRVLEQAQDSENPLLERVKFLSIVSSNLNEL